MAPSLDSIVKRLTQLEKAQGLTTKLAVQTDLDVQRERVRNQVVFHLRGDLLSKMEELYKEPGLDGALKLVASRGDETQELFRNKAFAVVLETLKERCQAAHEAGKAHVACEAVTGLFALDCNALLAGFHLHGAEPQDQNDGSSVWHGTLDFRYSLDGAKAAQAFHFDLQPFSYGDLTYHAGRPKPASWLGLHRLLLKGSVAVAAELCGCSTLSCSAVRRSFPSPQQPEWGSLGQEKSFAHVL